MTTLQSTYEEKYQHIVETIVEGIEHYRFTERAQPIIVAGIRLELVQCFGLNLISQEFYEEEDAKLARLSTGEEVSQNQLGKAGEKEEISPRQWINVSS